MHNGRIREYILLKIAKDLMFSHLRRGTAILEKSSATLQYNNMSGASS